MTTTKTLAQLGAEMGSGQPDAVLITEDSHMVELNLPADPEHFAEYAAAVLRCDLIEHVKLAPGLHLWMDEEGLGERPRNRFIAWFTQNHPDCTELIVHGPALITGHHGDRVAPLEAVDYLQVALAYGPLSTA
ncbi:hypothetical protein [Streptomyces siamensis]|uniref:Uncharacterized protein n=1 Tax=Streptomyces siamensis TaxID=1274986 RepID=A0ABP9IJ82_9ACTN